ncbi:MAG TPA: TonB-dependent receptor [Steroidobacteraceae bacterium]|jgi:iron complex outermembrane receptor protein|nr:TonB-dependent receptor [Steroidobacteraceae bacterium]
MNASRSTVAAFVCSAIAAAGAGPVLAADTASGSTGAESGDLQEVVVTARRIEERLQDVPISITVFNENQLQAHNIIGAEDLQKLTPSMSVDVRFGSNRTSYAIRGFNQETGTAPSVGTYFADVVSPRSPAVLVPGGDGAGPGFFFDLQNIQVLKGPQGTLFGRNTTGGDVMLVPQKPTANLEGYVQGAFGDFGYHEGEGVINIPVNDSLRLRFGVQHKDRDGYLINKSGIGPSDFDDINYTAVRGSAVWDVMSNLENYTIFSYVNSSTNGSYGKLVAGDPSLPQVGALFGIPAQAELAQEKAQGYGFYDSQQQVDDPIDKLEVWQVINTTTWTASDNFTLKNIASYAELKSEIRTPLIGSNFNTSMVGFPVSLPYVFFAVGGTPGEPSGHESTLTEELRVNGELLNDRLSYQGGIYTEFSRPLGTSTIKTVEIGSCTDWATYNCTSPFGLGAGSLSINRSQAKYQDIGLYTQETYSILSNLKVTAGARETWDHEHWDVQSENDDFAAFPAYGIVSSACTNYLGQDANCFRHLTEKSNRPTWLIDMEYEPTTDEMMYAKYSRGYRAGAVEAAIIPQFVQLKPERLDAYEVGSKTEFHWPIRGTFNASVFYNDFVNQQLQLNFYPIVGTGLPATAVPINAGKSRIWGTEIGINLNPIEGLLINADYAYLNAKILSIPDFTGAGGGLYNIASQYMSGDPIPYTPRNKVVVGTDYTLPLPDTIGKVSFGATYSHAGRQSVAPSDRQSTDPTTQSFAFIGSTDLVDLNVTWHSVMRTPLDLTVFGTNVTNFHYYTFAQQTGASGAEYANVGPPAMYGVRLRYSFGPHAKE